MLEEKRTNGRSSATMVVASIANEGLTYAVDYAERRLGSGKAVADLLRQDMPEAQEYFRYGLASRLASALGALDPSVRAVYLHDIDETGEEIGSTPAHLSSPLTLVVRVNRKTAAFAALLNDLDVAVTSRYRALVSPAAAQLRSLLNFTLVDDEETRERTGYGAIITSPIARPERIWGAG